MGDNNSRTGSHSSNDNPDTTKPSSMSSEQRADLLEQIECPWDREKKRVELLARDILDGLPQGNLYQQQDLGSWRKDIPGFHDNFEDDPSLMGLDYGEFNPPPPKPPPKSILKPVSSSIRAPPPRFAYTNEQRMTMKAAVMDEHRPGYLLGKAQSGSSMGYSAQPLSQQPSLPPSQNASRGGYQDHIRDGYYPANTIIPAGTIHPANTVKPAWATIKGPSQDLQDIMAARDAAPNGSQGRAQDAIYDTRAQDAASRTDPGHANDQSSGNPPRQFVNPVPNPPADRFLADNRSAIPRGAHPDEPAHPDDGRDDYSLPKTVAYFVKLREDVRKKERENMVEKNRLEAELNGGKALSIRPGRYWGINPAGETQLFSQTEYGYTPGYGALRQPGDDPKMKDAEKNTAYVEPWALQGHTAAKRHQLYKEAGAVAGFSYPQRQGDRRGESGGNFNDYYTAFHPQDPARKRFSADVYGNTPSMPVQPDDGHKSKAKTPPPPSV